VDIYAEKYDNWTSYAYVKNNPIKSIDIQGDTIVNASSPGSQEYAATTNALGVLQQTNPEEYTTLQSSTTNYDISYQADLKSDDGQALDGVTEVTYNHNSWTATATTDAKGNITGGTFGRPLNGVEQDALRAKGVDPKGQTIPVSDDDANSQIQIKGDVIIKLNSSLLSDPKQLTVTLAHEFGHGAFAQLHAAVSKLWGLIGKASALGHDKNNPSGKRAKEEEKKARDNYDNAKK